LGHGEAVGSLRTRYVEEPPVGGNEVERSQGNTGGDNHVKMVDSGGGTRDDDSDTNEKDEDESDESDNDKSTTKASSTTKECCLITVIESLSKQVNGRMNEIRLHEKKALAEISSLRK
jgi:hypothetical protein